MEAFSGEDLARALTKTRDGGGFILSWEQGGGKTLGAAGYALGAVRNGARNQVLFIVPQDLIPQYRQDISERLGITVEHITTPSLARRVAKHLRAGGEGWYITHYEVLSLLGVKNKPLPVQAVPVHEAEGERVVLDSTEFCPVCRASRDGGWQKHSPLVCSAVHTEEVKGEERTRTCGYVHKALRVKSAAHYLAGAFRDGVICIDEGTLIKGDDSQRSKAIRGLQARNKLLATGTPISNYELCRCRHKTYHPDFLIMQTCSWEYCVGAPVIGGLVGIISVGHGLLLDYLRQVRTYDRTRDESVGALPAACCPCGGPRVTSGLEEPRLLCFRSASTLAVTRSIARQAEPRRLGWSGR